MVRPGILMTLTLVSAVEAFGQSTGAEATTADPSAVAPEPVSAAAAPPSPPRGGIEEIVVTAQKRAENLQDVPISIQAFAGDALTDLGITDTQSLQQITPGLIYGSNAGYAQAYIRGIGSETTLPTADPSVASYVDGVYLPVQQSTIQRFGNVDRIEVLKGPQGTLYGRNTTGGAINVVTRNPGDAFEVKIDTEVGEFDHGRLSLYTNVPVLDSLAFNFSGFGDRSDAYYEQTNPTGPKLIDTEDWGIRGKILFAPGEVFFLDDFKLLFSGFLLDHAGVDTNIWNQFDPSPLANLFGAMPTPEPYKASTDLPASNFTRIQGGDLRATFGFPWFDLLSITAYQDLENRGFVDYDGTPAHAAGFGAQPGVSETLSEEVQILSKDFEWFNFVAGAYYLTGDAGFVPLNFVLASPLPALPLPVLETLLTTPPPVPLPMLPPPDITVPSQELPPVTPIPDLPIPGVPGDAVYIYVPLLTVVDTDAYAGFGHFTLNAFDWLRLTAGLRYSTETRALSRNEIYQAGFITEPGTADRNPPPFPPGPPIVRREPRSKNFGALSPKFGLEVPLEKLWFVDSVLLYASYTKGFKSGTFNPVALLEEPDPVDQEEVTAIEFGFKSDLFDGRFRLNVSAFTYDYQDLQLQTIALTSGGAVRLENAGEADVRGLDFDFQWATPISGLQLGLNGAFLDSEYKVCNCSGFAEDTHIAFKGDFSGNELVRAPRFTGTAELSYAIDIWGGPLEASGTAYYNDGYWFDAQNTFFQGSYPLYGARLSYRHEWSGVRVSFFGQNLSDQLYFLNGNVNDFGRFATYGPPRTFGLRVQWQFPA